MEHQEPPIYKSDSCTVTTTNVCTLNATVKVDEILAVHLVDSTLSTALFLAFVLISALSGYLIFTKNSYGFAVAIAAIGVLAGSLKVKKTIVVSTHSGNVILGSFYSLFGRGDSHEIVAAIEKARSFKTV